MLPFANDAKEKAEVEEALKKTKAEQIADEKKRLEILQKGLEEYRK